MNNMDKVKALNLLGMAYRARKVINGYDSVMIGITSNKAKIVLVASDASSKTIEAFSKKCHFYNVPMYVCFDTAELSKAIGKGLKMPLKDFRICFENNNPKIFNNDDVLEDRFLLIPKF